MSEEVKTQSQETEKRLSGSLFAVHFVFYAAIIPAFLYRFSSKLTQTYIKLTSEEQSNTSDGIVFFDVEKMGYLTDVMELSSIAIGSYLLITAAVFLLGIKKNITRHYLRIPIILWLLGLGVCGLFVILDEVITFTA